MYEEFRDIVFAVAYRLTDSADDAQDVLQEVFVRLPDALKQFEYRSSLGTWLRTVTVRRAMQVIRTRDRRREMPLPDDLQGRPPKLLDMIALERALAGLSDNLKAVIILKDVEGYSHEEIAELLEITPSASATRISRARHLLRIALGGR